MATFQEHLQKHSKRVVYHVKKHHKKYIFGIVGWAIAVKLVLTLIASVSLYEWYDTFAQEIPLENINWDILTWDILTWDILTWWNLTWSNQTGLEITWSFTQQPDNQLLNCNSSDFNFINPLSWSKLKWIINFSWTYIWTDCSWKNFDIYLQDHNNQRLKIWTSSYLNTRFQFNSSKLYSGFYNILWVSWNIIYTWQYSWLNSKLYNGYKIKFIDKTQNIIYTWDIFTINNQLPEITWIVFEFTWNYNSWYIWLSGIINLKFTATEDITWIIVNILWTNANFVNKSWLNYKYSIILSNQNTWDIVYSNISFNDLVWNTWSRYITSQVVFDRVLPLLNYILFTWDYTWFNILRSWNKLTKYEFIYALSWSQTWLVVGNSNYIYTGLINITWLNKNQIYNFILKLTDIVNNIITVWGKISFNTWWKVLFTYQTIIANSLVSTWSTGTTISNLIRQEINKFNDCKKDIEITNINIKINNQDIKLNMPNFEKSYVRTLVNSFTIIIMDKLQKSNLTKEELSDIANRFDDFLIILKLVRDDDNQCKQNLSNYHIRLFQKALQEYDISIE